MPSPDPLRPLLEAALEGDDRALTELVRRVQPDVWRLCSVLGSPGEEEDLVQETFLRALRGLDGYRGEAPVRAWLLAIGRRVCADHVRRRQRQRRLARRLEEEAGASGGGRSAGTGVGAGGLDDLVAALHPDRRDAFVLTQLLGLSYEEAAAALDCPVGTIRSRVSRARADLLTAVRQAEVG